MKRKSWNGLYDIRNDLIRLFLDDEHKPTRKEINRLIKSLTRILDNNL